MKETKFYPTIWQTIPFSFDLYNWDSKGKCIKDLVLKNTYATEMRVSEMQLNLNRFSAFDSSGKEHFIADFSGQDSLLIKGIHAGHFLRSKGILLLEPGFYTAIRFYFGTGSCFIYSDRVEEPTEGFEYLDFEIVNGLTIKGDESPEALLRFDFVPFKVGTFRNAIKHLFKVPRHFAGKLADNLSH
ncbi:hypothetical protein [Pricia sp.]|uniref:hypothetical protein n=1 Tax=Pricia sp. TaxID=2268138 RepID=UPI0035937290